MQRPWPSLVAHNSTSANSNLLIRRRRRSAVIAQDTLRGLHEVRLAEVEDSTRGKVQEPLEEIIVFGGELGWLAVWAAGGWACAGGHCLCWLVARD